MKNYITVLFAAGFIMNGLAGSVAAFDSRIASDAEQSSKDGFIWKDAAAFPLESKVCASTATPYGRIPADMMDKVSTGVKCTPGNSTGSAAMATVFTEAIAKAIGLR